MHTGLHTGNKGGTSAPGRAHVGQGTSGLMPASQAINGLGGNMEQLQYDLACPVALGGTRHGGYAPYLGSTGPTG